jgi:hypothetical protein
MSIDHSVAASFGLAQTYAWTIASYVGRGRLFHSPGRRQVRVRSGLNLPTMADYPNAGIARHFMEENKILATVQACISDARKTDKPFRSINESLALLKRHGWTEAERLEVQTQVLQELKRRRNG